MAESTTQTAQAEEPVKMYRNRTKLTQIVYPAGPGDKRIVRVGETVCLTEKQYKRFFSLFAPVETAEPEKK